MDAGKLSIFFQKIFNLQVSYTSPCLDSRTGEMVVSAVMTLNDAKDKVIGVLAIDLNVDWLNDYVQALSLSRGGYGVIISQNMMVVAHPKEELKSRQLHELGPHYDKLSSMLRNEKTVFAEQITNFENETMLVFFSKLFNSWYVGLVTPKWTFYQDMYYALAILSLLGLVLSIFLSLLLLRLEMARIRSDKESKSKSSFLARMSHEIRTPMNAIIGMGELALQAETLPKAMEYIKGIKQAGYNLLSLINDILDFSKAGAGNIEIVNTPYNLSSLLNDVINVARVHISEKPILFIVNVDASIPNRLIGDEARIRQILLNLLSNAAKYTKEGFIMLTLNASYSGTKDDKLAVTLSMEIADSGIGIKKDDLSGLFGNFVRLDAERNRSIEGTGLGLAITRSLCRAMGGDITVISTYGEGSVFTVAIPQSYSSDLPLASVEDPLLKETLVYDERKLYTESVSLTLRNLKVLATVAAGVKEVPIIALTANAISGMKEMFLSKGFSDYLSKPIEIAKMNEIIGKWMPRDKREMLDISERKTNVQSCDDGGNFLIIRGLNVNKGIAMTGGTFKGYLRVLAMFRKDAEERLVLLRELPDEARLPLFTSQVHALKGASGALGAEEISAEAAEIEVAGKAGNVAVVANLLPGFVHRLTELIEEIRLALDNAAETPQTTGKAALSRVIPLLRELSDALKTQEAGTIDRILSELGKQSLDSGTKELLERVSDEVLMTEFDEALKIVEEFIKNVI